MIFTTVDSKTEVKTLSFNMVRLTKVQKWSHGCQAVEVKLLML